MTTLATDSRVSRDEFTRRLQVARGRLRDTVATAEHELAGLERPRPGGHGVAAAVAGSVLSRLSQRERQELDEIAAAELRLATGAYGLCEACGNPLPLARLRALPAARQCVSCQRDMEGRALRACGEHEHPGGGQR